MLLFEVYPIFIVNLLKQPFLLLFQFPNATGIIKMPSPQEGIVTVGGYLDFEPMYQAVNNISQTIYTITVLGRVS